MTEIGQTEIRALLQAVEDGEVESAPDAPQTRGVTDYDFKRPERVGKDQIRALERLHEVFSRNVSATLSSQMRTVIECHLAGTEQATYHEFINSVENPTCFNFIRAEELEGDLILDIEPRLVFTMFDKLTGGGAQKVEPPQRAMTDLEWIVMKPTLDRILTQLGNAWEGLFALTLRYGSHETNPQLAQNIAPNEPVVLVSFHISIGSDERGRMVLCLPHNTIEPVLSRMAGYWFGNKVHRTEATRNNMQRKIKDAPVELTCTFKPATLDLRQLADLEVGDILRLDHPVDRPLTLEVDGHGTFEGQPGTTGPHNRLCIRVTNEAK
jgi:flagellar motor switch protein FliM